MVHQSHAGVGQYDHHSGILGCEQVHIRGLSHPHTYLFNPKWANMANNGQENKGLPTQESDRYTQVYVYTYLVCFSEFIELKNNKSHTDKRNMKNWNPPQPKRKIDPCVFGSWDTHFIDYDSDNPRSWVA